MDGTTELADTDLECDACGDLIADRVEVVNETVARKRDSGLVERSPTGKQYVIHPDCPVEHAAM